MNMRPSGYEIPDHCPDVAPELGTGRALPRAPAGNPPGDLYDERHRINEQELAENRHRAVSGPARVPPDALVGADPGRAETGSRCVQRTPSGEVDEGRKVSDGFARLAVADRDLDAPRPLQLPRLRFGLSCSLRPLCSHTLRGRARTLEPGHGSTLRFSAASPFPRGLSTDAEGETRTPTNRFTRPSNVRVYQFRHIGLQNF
jgi:hypothetical protein